MEVALSVILFTFIAKKKLSKVYKNHSTCIIMAVAGIGILAAILLMAVYEKISLVPMILLL
jgi:hypothetical protein